MSGLADGTRRGMSAALLLRLGRVSNLPTVWSNVLAAAVLAGAPLRPVPVVLVLVAVSCAYVAGMLLNDAFDRSWDAERRPERSIPSGLVDASTVFAWGFGVLGAGVALVPVAALVAGASPGAALLAAAALAGAILLYDAWHKDNPAAPLLMGLCRVLVYVTTGVALAGGLPAPLLAGAAVLLAYLMGLTAVAREETRGRIASNWPAALLAVPLAYGLGAVPTGVIGAACWIALAVWIATAVRRLAAPAPGAIPVVVGRLIAGIALVDAVLAARHGAPAVAGLAVAACLATIAAQRRIAGT
jgi:4-hydroxybenzoate polyprenyltransferase